MKIIDKYLNIKSENLDSVIIIKSGNFYVTFDDDAFIISYLMNYQIVQNKVGFPLLAKDKIIDVLNIKGLNVIQVIDDNITLHEANDNNYKKVLIEAKDKLKIENELQALLRKVELKVRNNNKLCCLIEEYIDEL